MSNCYQRLKCLRFRKVKPSQQVKLGVWSQVSRINSVRTNYPIQSIPDNPSVLRENKAVLRNSAAVFEIGRICHAHA